jgi:hypothetical protein
MRGIIAAEVISRRSSIIAASTTCERAGPSYLHHVVIFYTWRGCATSTCAFNVIYVIRVFAHVIAAARCGTSV